MIKVTVGEVAVISLEVLDNRDSIDKAWRIMQRLNYWILPVVDIYGQFIGGLHCGQITGALVKGISSSTTIEGLDLTPCPLIITTMLVVEALKLNCEIFAVSDSDGKFIGLIDRARLVSVYAELAEVKLRELDAIFTFAHNGILSIDNKGVITSINPAAERLSKRNKQEALGQFLADVVIPTGLLQVVKTGQPQFGTKYVVGKKKYITNRTPIFKDGNVVGAVGVFQDISEIEKVSVELDIVKELNRELRSVIDCSYDGILIFDSQGQITKGNLAFERITGIAMLEIQDKTMDYLVEKGYIANQVVAKVFENKDTVSVIERQTPLQNCLLVTASPVLSEDKRVLQVVINIRDITELNKLHKDLGQTKELSKRYETELNELRGQIMQQEGVVARSESMKHILDLAWRVAQVDSTVLLLGESGVGKEVLAKFIHLNSQRKAGSYIKINCAAIPEQLLESELFGYEPGSFTGAGKIGKPGLFEIAENGTVFLDEIGDLPLGLQAKLLRVLQERELLRVGGIKAKKINIRIIAATNQKLDEKVRNGLFRTDLYYRLNVVPILIPPLRERVEDIYPLLVCFKERVLKKYNLSKEFTPDAIDMLISYKWPGNVREMENLMERFLVCSPGQMITPQYIEQYIDSITIRADEMVSVNGLLPLHDAVEELEKQLLYMAWNSYRNTYRVATVLQVNQSTVVRKLKKLNIRDNFTK